MAEIKIIDKIFSENSRPFIIAEAGVNYYDIAKAKGVSLVDAAKLMIKEAAKAKIDAIKFQIYKAEKLASRYSPAYWDTSKEPTKSQYELFKKFDKLSDDDYRELAKYCENEKIIFMATPFDQHAVELVDELSPVFKIASADITNFPLIAEIAKKGKLILLSTGASTLEEIKEAINIIKNNGNDNIVLLHCVLNYPTKYEDANLNKIKWLKENFPNYLIGYSDHTLPDRKMLVITAAYLLGARVLEKHFTLDKKLEGNDHYHAGDPDDFKDFISNLDFIEKICGRDKNFSLENEATAIKFARRSLVAKRDLMKGEKISVEDIEIKRPGTGISPKFVDKVIGKVAVRDIKEDEILSWDDFVQK